MKSKKLLVLSVAILIAMILVALPLKAGCANPPSEVKTIKIGLIAWSGWGFGLMFERWMNVIVETTNNEGGLLIGGDRYKIDLIVEESKMQADVAKAAAERLVYQDKVKFILGDETLETWLPITEQNKVVVVGGAPTMGLYTPRYKYCYQGTTIQTQHVSIWGGWFAKYPDLKTIVSVAYDTSSGHASGGRIVSTAEHYGLKTLEAIYVPNTLLDYSTVATRIKALNPDAMSTAGIPADRMGLLFKALYQAGWKGKILLPFATTAMTITRACPQEALEGVIAGMLGTEFESPQEPLAKKIKDAYIAKYRTWDDPDTLFAQCWYVLVAGLEKAKSVDPEIVAATMNKGMTYDSLNGTCMLVARPDLGVTRACDTIMAYTMKTIVNGKPNPIGKITIDKAFAACKEYFGWK
jgi:branched-chain amino acid transport system substrate-binding protein